MNEPRRQEEVETPVRRNRWAVIVPIVGLMLLVLILVYVARRGNPDQDKLTNAQVAATNPPPRRDKICASSATYDLVKREIFRRAAQLRGSDQAAFDRLSAAAVVRMENPVMVSAETTGAVNCTGSLSLDLPPGVAVVGGRRTLAADVDYSVTSAADGSGPVVLLRNADAVIALLATLEQVSQVGGGQAPSAPVASEASPTVAPAVPQQVAPAVPQQVAPAPAPSSPAPAARPTSARPSFDCARARTPGELAVCNDAGLAALDRQMAAQYAHALALASPDQRVLLRDTARRFYEFRDRCSTSACIADGYSGRMREIRDIVEDRWQPPR